MPRREGREKKADKYRARFYKLVPTAIFSLAGIFYLVVPYNIIVASGLGFRAVEGDQFVFGIVFLVIAAAFWLVSRRRRD